MFQLPLTAHCNEATQLRTSPHYHAAFGDADRIALRDFRHPDAFVDHCLQIDMIGADPRGHGTPLHRHIGCEITTSASTRARSSAGFGASSDVTTKVWPLDSTCFRRCRAALPWTAALGEVRSRSMPRRAENLLQKTAAVHQPLLVDRVLGSDAGKRLDRNADRPQRRLRFPH
jgi:hypothetical protein